MPKRKPYRHWTGKEDEYLRDNLALSNDVLAERLDRTTHAVNARRFHLDHGYYAGNKRSTIVAVGAATKFYEDPLTALFEPELPAPVRARALEWWNWHSPPVCFDRDQSFMAFLHGYAAAQQEVGGEG